MLTLHIGLTHPFDPLSFQITYYLEDGVAEKYPVVLDPSDGSIYVRGELDRERESEFTFQVVARDGGSNSSRPSGDGDGDDNDDFKVSTSINFFSSSLTLQQNKPTVS